MTEETNIQNRAEVVLENPTAVSKPPSGSIDSGVQPEIQPESSLSQSQPEPEQPESSPESEPVMPQQQTALSVVVPPPKLTPKELWARFREKVIERKSKKLEKIMTLVIKRRRVTNDEVQKLLNVSDATATRYLKELVRQGRLKQLGIKSATIYEPSQ